MRAEGSLILCPFYKSHEAVRIYCEGVRDDCRNGLWFFRKEPRRQYMSEFCKKDYKECMIYRMLEQKYE